MPEGRGSRNRLAQHAIPHHGYTVQCCDGGKKTLLLLFRCRSVWMCVFVCVCLSRLLQVSQLVCKEGQRESVCPWVLWPVVAESSIWGVSCFIWRWRLLVLWYGRKTEMWEQRRVLQRRHTINHTKGQNALFKCKCDLPLVRVHHMETRY